MKRGLAASFGGRPAFWFWRLPWARGRARGIARRFFPKLSQTVHPPLASDRLRSPVPAAQHSLLPKPLARS
jgi:hypothetical protein